MTVIDDYVSRQPEPHRTTLAGLTTILRSLLPRAEEDLAYGMPAWKVDGTSVAGFSASKAHCSYVPYSGGVTETLADALSAYEITKGTVKLPSGTSLPKGLVKKLVAARLAEISMVPDSKGAVRDFYADGGLKAKGRQKVGELHGSWQWWRQDGSLLRSGSFDRGRQVGEWTTYDRASNPVKVSDFGR